jgi:hypothetical protein
MSEDAALVGDAAAEDDVEGGDAIGGDDEEAVGIDGIDVADFSAADEFKAWQIRFEDEGHVLLFYESSRRGV